MITITISMRYHIYDSSFRASSREHKKEILRKKKKESAVTRLGGSATNLAEMV